MAQPHTLLNRDSVKAYGPSCAEATEDYIFATGRQYKVRDFVQEAFGLCGYDIKWRGSGTSEVGF